MKTGKLMEENCSNVIITSALRSDVAM